MTTRADVLGLCVHPGRPGLYADVPAMIADLQELGVRRLRLRAVASELAHVPALLEAGFHLTLICWTLAEADKAVAAKAHRLELRNEPNLDKTIGSSGDGTWPNVVRALSAEVYGKYGGKIEVIAASLGRREGYDLLGMVTQTDTGNIHLYPGGENSWALAADRLTSVIGKNRLNSGYKRLALTETGFHNAMAVPSTEGHRPTSEEDAAARLPGWLDRCYSAGVSEVYLYEWGDEGTDQADREDNFGMVRADGSRKPIWTALRDWLAAPDPALAAALAARDAAVAACEELAANLQQANTERDTAVEQATTAATELDQATLNLAKVTTERASALADLRATTVELEALQGKVDAARQGYVAVTGLFGSG